MSKNKNYFGKNGKTFGPFTDQEVEQMHVSSKISDFTWIWDYTMNQWKTIDPPPPPLTASHLKLVKSEQVQARDIQAVCHDFKSAVAGSLHQITETGCEMVCHSSEALQMRVNSTVFLNLFSPKTGQSVNIQAKLIDLKRSAQGWICQIRWPECPSLISAA